MSGLLDLTLPWAVLALLSTGPGLLGRIGPITATQAARLADAAAADPAAQWRIIVTTPAGQAIAVSRVPRRALARDGPATGAGLTGRITLIISEDDLTSPPGQDLPAGLAAGGIVAAALRAARRALARAREQARADAAAGGSAHARQSQSCRPPPRLQEFVVARDLTCRFPGCGQPAWRGDLDHTVAWPHRLKQLRDWALRQTSPGTFEWTTPSGRTYPATPGPHIS